MKTGHLSETDLQQYALNKANCDISIFEHINRCGACKAGAAVYQQLFSAIQEQPKPVFDFDISTIILDQLPEHARASKANGFGFTILIGAAVAFAGVPLYLFRQSILTVLANLSSVCMYGIIAASLAVLLYRLVNMYRLYQKKVEAVNFY